MKNSEAAMLVYLLLTAMVIFSSPNPVTGSGTRKLDETPSGGDQKCSPSCTQNPPPPPPPSPCPPPPSPPPPPKKPPSPPYPSGPYCPPPPVPFLYITGPPGDLYPVDHGFDYNGATKSGPILAGLPILVACGLLGVFAFW